MSLSIETVKKTAHLARIYLTEGDAEQLQPELNKVLAMADAMATVDTSSVSPIAHPLHISQRLRADIVTEVDQRPAAQAIAPKIAQDLYLVPKVIE